MYYKCSNCVKSVSLYSCISTKMVAGSKSVWENAKRCSNQMPFAVANAYSFRHLLSSANDFMRSLFAASKSSLFFPLAWSSAARRSCSSSRSCCCFSCPLNDHRPGRRSIAVSMSNSSVGLGKVCRRGSIDGRCAVAGARDVLGSRLEAVEEVGVVEFMILAT